MHNVVSKSIVTDHECDDDQITVLAAARPAYLVKRFVLMMK